jgi:hypothetical protein
MAIKNISLLNTEPYRGPSVGCGFCVYELRTTKRGPCPDVRRATQVLDTPRGARQVCGEHARRGDWSRWPAS